MINRSSLLAIATLAAAGQAFAVPEVIFDNTASTLGSALGAVTGTTYADDVTFGGSSRTITQIDIPVIFSSLNDADMQADVTAFIYDLGSNLLPANIPGPGAVLWTGTLDNVPFNFEFDIDGFPIIKKFVTFAVPNITVPNTIRWGVQFTDFVNITGSDVFGVDVGASSSTPAGSANFLGPLGTFQKTAAAPNFTLSDITGAPDSLGVRFTAENVVPEPTSASLLGLAALVFRAIRRKRA